MARPALLRRSGSTALSLSSARLRNSFRPVRCSNGTSNSPRRSLVRTASVRQVRGPILRVIRDAGPATPLGWLREMAEKYYDSVLERLKVLSDEHGLDFHPETTERFEWMLRVLLAPRIRKRFALEGKSSAIVGMILVPEPSRKHDDVAWNRFEKSLRLRIEQIERDGYDGKGLSIVIVQVWERERSTVVLPHRELEKTKRYRDTGNFKIKNDCGEFFLETAAYEATVKLSNRLEAVLKLLPAS